MSNAAETVVQHALGLPESERWMVVTEILRSLPPDFGLNMDDPHLIQELDRRCADLEGAVPWEELDAE
jgi:hypothetical protein